jgi:hypothetical protein
MWSEVLQQQTREFLEQYQAAAMKHFGDSRFGLCVFIDGKYVITDREDSGDVWEYDSVDEMIEDGWAID